MRHCLACGNEDRLWFEDAACSCGADKAAENAGDPTQHRPECTQLGHYVVMFPIRLKRTEVDLDGKALLSASHIRKGWGLLRNGMKFYRVKMLCRDCAWLETQAQARRAEYEKLSREALGIDTSTYAQMIALQDQL